MEVNRLELKTVLENAMLDAGEVPRIYFQPPEGFKLEYPCIIYQLGTLTSDYADNAPYRHRVRFEVTYITRSPTSEMRKILLSLPTSAFDRYFVTDNLHHYVYNFTSSLKEE